MLACKTVGFICFANAGLAVLAGLIVIIFCSNDDKAMPMTAIAIGMSVLSLGIGILMNKILAPILSRRLT
jgi:hypothetical protein